MFIPDLTRALAEMNRVLKGKGRIAATVWASARRNPRLSDPLEAARALGVKRPPTATFRIALRLGAPSLLAATLRGAGFSDVVVERWPVVARYDTVNVVYADSKAHCLELAAAGGPQHFDIPVTYAFVVSTVIQFKDEATAAREYSASVFTISPTAFDNLPAGFYGVVGSATGFGLNSERYFCTDCSQGPGTGYEVLWQNKTFDVVISFANLDLAVCKTIAVDVNSRIV